jgi:hypothetical protein
VTVDSNDTFGWEVAALVLAGAGATLLGGSVIVLANKSPATWSRVQGAVVKLLRP